MMIPALYRLERKGALPCDVIGVGRQELTSDEIRAMARESIEHAAESIDEDAFERFAKRLSYIVADAADPSSYERLVEALAPSRRPVFYLATPPSLFGPIVESLGRAGLAKRARVVVEKPFGHDLASARALNEQLLRDAGRGSHLPDRPFPGQGAGAGHRVPALRERDLRADLEPASHRIRADHPRGVVRHRGPRQLLRRRGSVARRRPEPPPSRPGPGHDGIAVGGQGRDRRSSPRCAPRDPRRGSRRVRPGAVRGLRRARTACVRGRTRRRSPPSGSGSTTGDGPAFRS